MRVIEQGRKPLLGANAHVILESYGPDTAATPALPKASALPIVVSARDAVALTQAARDFAECLSAQPQSALYDIAYQSVFGRERHAQDRRPRLLPEHLNRRNRPDVPADPFLGGSQVRHWHGGTIRGSGRGRRRASTALSQDRRARQKTPSRP